MSDFSGWIPMRIDWEGPRPMVDWGWLGNRRLIEPFFEQSIARCVHHPADVLFRHQTSLDELAALAPTQPSATPKGFIFHMSRCGSTLLTQMLAASPRNLVLSEPSPIDTVLRAHFHNPEITEAQRVQWLQDLVRILAWRRHPEAENLFIKFDCWHTPALPLIHRAFPGVPWIFLYREPVEVMASQGRQLGGQMIPGVLEPGWFGWEAATVNQMARHEYGARTLAAICSAALAQIKPGGGRLVNYRQLPAAVWPALLAYWRVEFSAEDQAHMLAVAARNAKNPVLPFDPDSQAKRDSVSPEIREITRQWLSDVYEQLEARREREGFATA